MLSSSSSVFDNLPARPPTPPRDVPEAVDDAISYLDDGNEIERALNPQAMKAPEAASPTHSASSSQELPGSANGAKKVGFTPRPTYHPIARVGQISSPAAQLRKRAPSSKDVRPLRSILKQSAQPPPLTPDDIENISYFAPKDPTVFGKMLQSVIQQLAGHSVTARRDAYSTLNHTLRAYEEIPDVDAVVSKMGLLMQFMTRDMAWKDANGVLDTNIIAQALKLSAACLSHPRLLAALDDDFRCFLMDRSLTVIETVGMGKALVKAHVYLLAQQRFRAPAMTPNRADRIITAMGTIEDRCSGNSIVAARLMVYHRLLEQTPAAMLQRAPDWIEHVMHGMMSTLTDVRIRGIETCTQAGLVLGERPQAAKAVMDLFQTEVEPKQTFYDHVVLRLYQMVSDKEISVYVPQIWSAIILLFRSKRLPVEKWPQLKAWLVVIQKCLNSSDLATKYQAHVAWNKLVYSVMPDSSTPTHMLSMLRVPCMSGMDRRGTDKHAKQVRQYALEAYHNLLHYALRPGKSFEELDSAWDVLIEQVLMPMVKANTRSRYIACSIVHGICTASSGVWNANAAHEPNPIRPDELPKVDPKWIRSRLAKILNLMEPVMVTTMWMSDDNAAAMDAAWYALMQSVAEAGAQEIKTSNDLKEAIARVVGLVSTMWRSTDTPPAGSTPSVFAQRLTTITTTAVQCIGAGPFAEDILTRSKDDKIQVASTPSHRASKHHSTPRSPFVLLFGLLYQPPVWLDSAELLSIASGLVQLQASTQQTPQAKLELLARSLHIWTKEYCSNDAPPSAADLWTTVAAAATGVLGTSRSTNTPGEAQSVGLELRYASAILQQGLQHHPGGDDVHASMIELYDAMLTTARRAAGAAATVVAVTEPFAQALLGSSSTVPEEARVGLSLHLLNAAVWPRSRQELDQSKKALWGVGLPPHKTTVFDPFDHTYRLMVDVLCRNYSELKNIEEHTLSAAFKLLDAALSFLKRCPLSLLAVALRKTQDGFACWLADGARKTASPEILASKMRTTWTEILRLMDNTPQKDSNMLKAFESLLIAGFSCPHKAVVNATIVFWNQSLGSQDLLEYPDHLASILRIRSAESDITVPNLPDNVAEAAKLPAFYESQPKLPKVGERSRTAESSEPKEVARVPATAPVHRSVRFPAKDFNARDRNMRSPAVTSGKSSAAPTPKARLRHDDSQVTFAPIESSPLRPVDESQMLTERQKEVKLRQHEEAHVFPGMSSSPVVKTTALHSSITKRLDFATKNSEEHAGTPSRLPEVDLPMSDDIPSSPTPSSNKDADSAQIPVGDDEMTEDDEVLDPPSSPPRQPDEDVVRVTEGEGYGGNKGGLGGELLPGNDLMGLQNEVADQSDSQNNDDPDLLSDTLLLAAQLQLEAEQATMAVDAEHIEDITEGSTSVNPQHHDQSLYPDETVQDSWNVGNDRDADDDIADITMVEDSFLELAAAKTEDATGGNNSPSSQRSTRKRKRASESGRGNKKRKQHSPLKAIAGFFHSFVSSHKPEDDDDIEEEIVVASSQPPYSPRPPAEPPKAPSPIVAVPRVSVEEAAANSQLHESSANAPPKRRRGRPRKSETPVPATSEPPTSQRKSLKRKASTLSEASVEEPATSFVNDTPAPAKTRKQREGPDKKLVKAARMSQESDVGRSRRRSIVTLSQPNDDEEEQDDEPNVQLAEVGVIASPGRPIASPRSIVGRFKDILAELRLPGFSLSRHEEREVDDVLFEIRREVHEAGRRAEE